MKQNWKGLIFSAPGDRVFDLALLFYRIGISAALFFVHGLPKLINYEQTVAMIPDPFGLGGTVNTILSIVVNACCAIMVALGWYTRLFILPILGLTLTGLFVVHFGDPLKVIDVPFMYSIAFGFLLVCGPGKYSFDGVLGFDRHKKKAHE